MVDVQTGQRRPAQTVLVVGNRVQAVGPVGTVRVPPGAQVVNAQGKYLIPGLWDMHTHIDRSPGLTPLFLAHGVTGIRDMAVSFVPLDSLLRWRRDIGAGRRVGPRIVATGGRVRPPQPDATLYSDVAATTPGQGRHAVDSLQQAGADFVKVYSGLARDVYFAVAAEARRVGIPFAGHLPEGITAAEASDSGQRSIEHFGDLAFLDLTAVGGGLVVNGFSDLITACSGEHAAGDAPCAALAERFTRNETWFTPTLAVYMTMHWAPHPAEGRPFWWYPVLQTMRRVHLPLLAGTDVGGPRSGASLHDELVLLVEAGLTPLEALRAATLNPAEYLRATDSLGSIAAGKLADLVLLDADPLTDIHNTTMIRAVVANGRYFDRTALDSLLASRGSTD